MDEVFIPLRHRWAKKDVVRVACSANLFHNICNKIHMCMIIIQGLGLKCDPKIILQVLEVQVK